MITFAIESAKKYHNYLEEQGRGLEEIGIQKITIKDEDVFILQLRQKLVSTDNIYFRINDVFVDDDPAKDKVLEIIEYDSDNNLLTIRNKSPNLPFKNLKEHEITIVSDLKFLVKNVEVYLDEYGDEFGFPERTPPLEAEVPSYLNDSQVDALAKVFNSPISYIWGAPGTGKTRAVLFESVMRYVRAGAKIAILAPTNNALEQILQAILPKFDEVGFERARILRVGTPSNAFFEEYPDVCETKILEKQKKQQSLFDLEEMEQESAKERIKKAKIIASTLDSFIMRSDINTMKFEHLFLDEAGFANLIKALCLCRNGVPLTMLGDHKQLPPICEMDERQILNPDNHPVCLWDMSALHLESFFHLESHELIAHYSRKSEPQFEKTAKADLTHTHRYGPNLCRILDQHIYQNGLQSSIPEDTEIFFVDSGFGKVNSNANEAEAYAVQNLAESLMRNDERDFGIITPFVNQRRTIQKLLPYELRQSHVLTIHRSQGREFETVIFSPVYLSKYFTNSHFPSAQKALNVAISRVKKRLVLVCDYNFWSRQRGQLIQELLGCAQPFFKR